MSSREWRATYRATHREENREYQREYRRTHREEKKAYELAYNIRHPESKRAAHLKRLYGITLEEYDALFDAQHGCCAICGKHQSILDRTLDVDHDHKTNRIRSLLCSHCNTVLGLMDDDPELLRKAAKYLDAQAGRR